MKTVKRPALQNVVCAPDGNDRLILARDMICEKVKEKGLTGIPNLAVKVGNYRDWNVLYIAENNPNGIHLDGVSYNTDKYSAIGMFNQDLFGLNKQTGSVEFLNVRFAGFQNSKDDSHWLYGNFEDYNFQPLHVKKSIVDKNGHVVKTSKIINYGTAEYDEIFSLVNCMACKDCEAQLNFERKKLEKETDPLERKSLEIGIKLQQRGIIAIKNKMKEYKEKQKAMN